MTVQVGKLTVRTTRRGAGRDAGFRVRAESRLRSLDLQPPGLPSRAVLIVRRMELGPVDGGTAERTRAALAEFRQLAARPAAGPVPAAATAVLFGDEVELLTCLTADLVRGMASRRWYWRQIGSSAAAERGAALTAAWMRDVRWLPGSLARLPEPEARSAVAFLSPPEAARVLRALLTAFGVEERPPPAQPPAPPDPPSPLDLPRRHGQAADAQPPDPPWRGLLQATSLHPDAEALLGVALSLHHTPALARRAVYAERLAGWRAAVSDGSRPQAPATGGPPSPTPAVGAPAGSAQRGPAESTAAPAALPDSGNSRPKSVSPITTRSLTQAPALPLAGRSPGGEPTAAPASAPHPAAPDRPGASAAPATEPPAEPHRDQDVPDAWTPRWPGEGITTGLASLLFLVNFVVWLDAEEDALVPAGWAFVDLLGRYLLGAQLGDFSDDPLWDVLAELDGRRSGIPPAVELEAADSLRLPGEWIRRWTQPSDTYVARRIGPRLAIRHCQAGFVVADVPCIPERLDEVLGAEAARLGDAEIIMEGQATEDVPTPEQRFEDAIGAFVGWLLHLREIRVSSLASPGQVWVTSTHVDVVLSLQNADLAVRMAGLDRDPGWVPGLGRIVLFHFLEGDEPVT